MKIIALDLGARRIGVAISDGQTVGSLDTIETNSREEALQEIIKISHEEQAEKIIIGLPKSDSGEAEDKVRSFAMEINKAIPIPIEFVDETLTSKEAERLLKNQKIDPKSAEYKREVDRVSAKLILEQYLNK